MWIVFYDRAFNQYRFRHGQPPRRENTVTACTEGTDNVMLVSAAYFGQPAADWPASVTMGGFSHWTGRLDERLDPAIDEYLNSGEPPVLVTLGSSAASAAPEQFARIAAALDTLGLRSLLLVANDTNLAAVRGATMHSCSRRSAKFASRCRAAVVSGSLGTLAAVLSAGVPVVVVPQLFDQVWHGGRAEQLGVGLLARRPSRVAAAVARLESDPSFATRAHDLARSMANDNGAEHLANVIEARLAAPHPSTNSSTATERGSHRSDGINARDRPRPDV
jgi:rhamnosyltransferase subunit B